MSSRQSSKRPRAITQQSAGSMRDAIALESAPTIYTRVSGISDQNGNERQSATSYPLKDQPYPNLTLRDLTSLVCPPFKVAITSYGFNGTLYSSADATTKPGNLRNIYTQAGRQYWFEAYGLPAYDISTNPTTMDVNQLMMKARDVRNIANIVNPAADPLNPSTTDAVDQQFQYMAGFQRHEFVNSGNTTVHCEFWELHPRHPMVAYALSGGAIRAATIGADVLADMVDNQPLANTINPTYTAASYDSTNDMSVRITKNLDRINSKYKVSKPVRVTIQPGGTFVYTMKFTPFKCTNTEWQHILYPPVNSALSAVHWMPGFTKILVGRMWGELSHNEGDGNHLYSAVNCGPINLMHIMKEYHHCRACPYQPTKNTIIDYRLDTSAAAVEHMDELNQDNEAFDD